MNSKKITKKHILFSVIFFSVNVLAHEETPFLKGYLDSLQTCEDAIERGDVDTTSDNEIYLSMHCKDWRQKYKSIDQILKESDAKKNRSMAELKEVMMLYGVMKKSLSRISKAKLTNQYRANHKMEIKRLKQLLAEFDKYSLDRPGYINSTLRKRTIEYIN
jgi:hypothetical protein